MTPENVRGWIARFDKPAFGVFLDGVLLEQESDLIKEPRGVDALAAQLSPGLCDWLRTAMAEKVIGGVRLHQHMGPGGRLNPGGVAALNFELRGVPASGSTESFIRAINSLCAAAGLKPSATTETDEDELKAMIAVAYDALERTRPPDGA